MSGSQNINPEFIADYVIIGSGSAGSAIASKLSEDGKHSVIVIEYAVQTSGLLSKCQRHYLFQ